MHNFYEQYQFGSFQCIIKQLLDSVFCHILNNKGFSKCNQSTLIIPGITKTPSNNGVFSHDVTAAILVSQNNGTAAMLVSQTNPLGVEFHSYANAFFCSNKFA